jgi:hypothetical protein
VRTLVIRGKQTALMPGNEDRVGYWLTPWDEEPFPAIAEEFGFDPPEWERAFDAAPYPRPAGFDGLKEPWPKKPVWVNPPFVGNGASRSAWARKIIAERGRGEPSVLIVPMDRWVGLLLTEGAEVRVPPPFKWRDPKGHPQVSGRPSLLFILRPKVPP